MYKNIIYVLLQKEVYCSYEHVLGSPQRVRMKGSRRTEAPGRNNTTAQLEEDPCRQNNKQNRQNNKQNKQNRQNNIVKSKWFH